PPAGKPHSAAFKPAHRIAAPKLIPPWFMPAEIPNKYYQETCDTVGQHYKDCHDTILDAVSFALNLWKLQAKFGSIQVMAVCAIGAPGCLSVPALESSVKMFPGCSAWMCNMGKHR